MIASLKQIDRKVAAIQGSEGRGGGPPTPGRPRPAFSTLNGEFASLATTVDSADTAPTPAMETAYGDYCRDLTAAIASWNEVIGKDIPGLNEQLAGQKLSALPAAPIKLSVCR